MYCISIRFKFKSLTRKISQILLFLITLSILKSGRGLSIITDPSFRVTLKIFLTILTQFGQPLHWSNMFYISIHFLFACLSKNHLYILIHCSPVSSTASRLAFRVIFPLYLSKILDNTFSYRLDLCFRIGYGSAFFFFRIFLTRFVFS